MIDKFHSLLRERGRSVTRSRSLLFEYLQEHGPVTPRQFIEDNAAIADRASLYRTLELFRELGVTDERLTAGRRLIELSDTYDAHHHHFTCTVCGASVAITMPEVEQMLDEACRRQGFAVSGHLIEVSGRCPNCQKAAAA